MYKLFKLFISTFSFRFEVSKELINSSRKFLQILFIEGNIYVNIYVTKLFFSLQYGIIIVPNHNSWPFAIFIYDNTPIINQSSHSLPLLLCVNNSFSLKSGVGSLPFQMEIPIQTNPSAKFFKVTAKIWPINFVLNGVVVKTFLKNFNLCLC